MATDRNKTVSSKPSTHQEGEKTSSKATVQPKAKESPREYSDPEIHRREYAISPEDRNRLQSGETLKYDRDGKRTR